MHVHEHACSFMIYTLLVYYIIFSQPFITKNLGFFFFLKANMLLTDFIDVTDQSSPFFSFLLCNVDFIKGADISLHL